MNSRGLQLLRAGRALQTTLRAAPKQCTPAASVGQIIARSLMTSPVTKAELASDPTASSQPTASPSPPTPTPSITLQNPPPPHTIKLLKGTVISAGLMSHTVRVQHNHFTFHAHLNKTFPAKTVYLVADPNDSLREGDVVEFANGWKRSRRVRHVVERIVAPFGSPVEARPPVLGRGEREARRVGKREEKLARREGRGGRVVREPYVGKIKRLVQERMALMSEEEKMRLREV